MEKNYFGHYWTALIAETLRPPIPVPTLVVKQEYSSFGSDCWVHQPMPKGLLLIILDSQRHWSAKVPRRIETHVRICVLSLLIERVAEIACQQPLSQIRRKLKMLQVSEFLVLKHRFYRRNKLSPEVSQTLKTLAVVAPKSILEVENISWIKIFE